MFVRSTLAVAIAALPLVLSPVAWAQTPETPPEASAPQAAPDAKNVEEVVVKGKFIANDASSALKFDVPIRDIPASTSNYSESFVKAIETSNVADLYKYMTGVQRSGPTGMDMTLRGFRTSVNDRNAIMTDGLPGLTARFGSPPTIGADHVEVVKGPASVLYGQAQPGGFINVISKKPKADFAAEVDFRTVGYKSTHPSLGLSDRPGYEGDFDVTGSLIQDASLMGRFVFSSVDNRGFRDNSWDQELYAAPSLTWKPSDATNLTLEFEYRHTNQPYDSGLMAPNKDITLVAPINVRYQAPNDYQLETGHTWVVLGSHAFDNGVKWNAAYRSVRHADNAKGWDQVSVTGTNVAIRTRNQLNSRRFDFADTSLIIPLDTGPVSHKIIAGVNGGRETLEANRQKFFNLPTSGAGALTLNLYNPDFSILPPIDSFAAVNPATPANLNDRYTQSLTTGVYTSDLMTLGEHWKANAGLRWTHDKQTQSERRLPNVPINQADVQKTLPTAALLFQPSEELTVYTSYSTSYVPPPSNAIDVNGINSFKPESAKQYELGLKTDLLAGKLTSTVAVFDIMKKDALTTFSCPIGTCTQQIGGQEAKGAEIELNWTVVDGWQITTGYAHTDSKITDSADPAQTGFRTNNAPLNNAHIWSRYDVPSGPLSGFGIGYGWVYVSQRTGTTPASTDRRYLVLPAYMTSDLAFYYVWDRYDVTLKVSNMFDKHFFDSAGLTGDINIVAGAPRNVALSFRAHF